MSHQDFSLWEDANQELLSICKSDNAFNIVYSKMQELYPDFHYMHMFSSPPLCFDQALAKFSPLLNDKEYIYYLLHFHFKRSAIPPASRKFGPFVGKYKRSSAIHFSRDHLLSFLAVLFQCKDITRAVLDKVWNKMHKYLLKCRTPESRNCFFSQSFDIANFVACTCIKDSDNASPAVRTKKPRLSHSTPVQTPHSSKRKRVSKPRSSVVFRNVAVQTWHSSFKYDLVRKKVVSSKIKARLITSARCQHISSTLEKHKADNKQLQLENGMLKANIDVLLHKQEHFQSQISFKDKSIAELLADSDNLKASLCDIKAKLRDSNNECKVLDDELCQYRDLEAQVDRIANDPDFKLRISEASKSYDRSDAADTKLSNQIPMRSSRKSINPKIDIALSILRHVGLCSLEKCFETLVLLGNHVFDQEWELSSDVSNKRARQMLPSDSTKGNVSESDPGPTYPNPSSSTSSIPAKRTMHKITKNTAPTQGYLRKFEANVYTPLALQSVAQELKSPNLVTSTIMYDGASIKKGKVMTVGVVNAVNDPVSSKVTSHYRQLGLMEMVKSDTDSSFKAVTSTLRNAAVLDSDTVSHEDVLSSTKDVFSNIDYIVTDLGGEMKPVSEKVSELKVSLGHDSRPTYIHCNAHVSPAFDSEIDKELHAIESLLDIKRYVDKGFNSSFFSSSRSCTYTMLHALFSMLGSSLYRQKEQSWSCQKDFTEFLLANKQPQDTFFDPNSSRFGKESEMCFILAFNFDNVHNFISSIHKDNRMFKSCEYYIKCPCFIELVISVALIFYHIYAPFLVAVGAETWLGHTLLTHSQLFSYYPSLKHDLEQLTIDPSSLFTKSRLPHLSDFPQLTHSSKVLYTRMADKIFDDLDSGIVNGEIESKMVEWMVKLLCERLLMVTDRQVDEYYGGPDSVVGRELAINPDKIDMAATTQLPCEHSVGTLRQSYRRGPTANIETFSQHQVIKKSPLYEKLLSGVITADQFGKMIKLIKKSASLKLYIQHRDDDRKKLKQEKVLHLYEQKKKRMKEVRDKAGLVSVVKDHGGPCQTEEDVEIMVGRYEGRSEALMKDLWNEIKYQKKVILCIGSADQSHGDLFKQRIWNRATRKYDPVPLEQRISNLKSILRLQSVDGDGSGLVPAPVISVDQFVEKASARHAELKGFKHRASVTSGSDDAGEHDIVDLTGSFYDGLVDEKFIAVFYSDDPSTPWYLGVVETVRSNDGCEQCEEFSLTGLNSFGHCFVVRFCEAKRGS
ncbi:uncharacterized protein LOC134824289 [Bolinopsis microptera]|uniref:uncharacterized protein LOC134824289 n=1 Tax=Bolinopsis microptera TaxID=2820187 RepID=UPI00307A335C